MYLWQLVGVLLWFCFRWFWVGKWFGIGKFGIGRDVGVILALVIVMPATALADSAPFGAGYSGTPQTGPHSLLWQLVRFNLPVDQLSASQGAFQPVDRETFTVTIDNYDQALQGDAFNCALLANFGDYWMGSVPIRWDYNHYVVRAQDEDSVETRDVGSGYAIFTVTGAGTSPYSYRVRVQVSGAPFEADYTVFGRHATLLDTSEHFAVVCKLLAEWEWNDAWFNSGEHNAIEYGKTHPQSWLMPVSGGDDGDDHYTYGPGDSVYCGAIVGDLPFVNVGEPTTKPGHPTTYPTTAQTASTRPGSDIFDWLMPKIEGVNENTTSPRSVVEATPIMKGIIEGRSLGGLNLDELPSESNRFLIFPDHDISSSEAISSVNTALSSLGVPVGSFRPGPDSIEELTSPTHVVLSALSKIDATDSPAYFVVAWIKTYLRPFFVFFLIITLLKYLVGLFFWMFGMSEEDSERMGAFSLGVADE